MATAGGGTAIPVASLDTWQIDMTTQLVDVTSFGDTNIQYVQGLPDAKGKLTGFWDDTDTTLMTARTSTAAVPVYLYPSTDAASKYAYGVAWVNATVDASVKDAVKISGTWNAGGNWTINW